MAQEPITCADVHFEDGTVKHMTTADLTELLHDEALVRLTVRLSNAYDEIGRLLGLLREIRETRMSDEDWARVDVVLERGRSK